MPPVILDHVARCADALTEAQFGLCRGPVENRTDKHHCVFRVLYNGVERDVYVYDDGRRPPDEGAFWLDDLVSAACRRVFGVDRGSARAIHARGGALEFREAWPRPMLQKLFRKVPITIHPGPQNDRELKDILAVQTTALPGADEESLILCSAAGVCMRRYGPGETRMAPHSPSHVEYLPGGNPTPEEVKYRHTIVRPGGVQVDLVTPVARRLAASFDTVVAAVEANCKKRFGPGTLSYEPELGETFFSFSA